MIFISPRYHGLGVTLRATGNHLGIREHLNIVIELLILGGPVF